MKKILFKFEKNNLRDFYTKISQIILFIKDFFLEEI